GPATPLTTSSVTPVTPLSFRAPPATVSSTELTVPLTVSVTLAEVEPPPSVTGCVTSSTTLPDLAPLPEPLLPEPALPLPPAAAELALPPEADCEEPDGLEGGLGSDDDGSEGLEPEFL